MMWQAVVTLIITLLVGVGIGILIGRAILDIPSFKEQVGGNPRDANLLKSIINHLDKQGDEIARECNFKELYREYCAFPPIGEADEPPYYRIRITIYFEEGK